jgi:hypothetical protein
MIKREKDSKPHSILVDRSMPIEQSIPIDNDGPYIAIAVFCERILNEKDGVLSVIRILDTFDVRVISPNGSADLKPNISIPALISFRSGAARGKKIVSIEVTTPSGEKLKSQMNLPVVLEKDELGVSLITTVNLEVEEEGIYWFDVLIDNLVMTRMPLKIRLLRE